MDEKKKQEIAVLEEDDEFEEFEEGNLYFAFLSVN